MSAEEIRTRYEDGLKLLPPHMHGGIIRYVERGIEPGTFLYSMLRGEIARAKMSADPANLACWSQWQTFLEAHLVPDCHGTPLKVSAWMKMKGLSGFPDAKQ